LIIKILLVISVGFNGYFIWDVIQIHNQQLKSAAMDRAFGGVIDKTTWSEGLKSFVSKLREKNKNVANKKYYYVNIWTTWCMPCVKEIPWLDSIAGTLKKDVGYIFVSDQTDNVITDCLKRKKFDVKNFVFLNDMNDFVSGICNERKITTKSYPMVLIMDNQGKIIHYDNGAYGNVKEAAEFIDLINKLE
jgi:thiol-disulfide isomerase/thioredoxin